MPDGTGTVEDPLYACTRCRQVYTEDHWLGGVSDADEGPTPHPDDARLVIRRGDAIPGGFQRAERFGCIPETPDNPAAWTPVEGGALVYDEAAERVAGIVGHFDDQYIDVERLTDGSLRIARANCYGDGRYRIIRL